MQNESPPKNGSCQGKPVNWFYPEPRTRSITKEVRSALLCCKGCKVRTECLEYALKWEMYGIWGGTTEKERHHIRSLRNITVMTPGFLEAVRNSNQ
jgi:WhiB family transcriptional regulator, redox-sensing transcriptional regulator